MNSSSNSRYESNYKNFVESESSDEEEEETPPLYRIYLGCDADKVDLPNNEMFFHTREEGNKKIDEINKESSCIKLSYDCVVFDPYLQNPKH